MRIKQVWYSNSKDLRSPETIHQILMFGSLQEILGLKKSVGEKKIRDLFLRYPKKIYTAQALNFIKNFILHINNTIDEKQYLTYTPRHIR